MTYVPQKSFRKSISSMRIVHAGGGNATMYLDNAAGVAIMFTLGQWTVIFSSSSLVVKSLYIFDSSGEVAQVGTGPASSEILQFRIIPGGNGDVPLQIDGSSRITLRYESVLPSAATETVINFFK